MTNAAPNDLSKYVDRMHGLVGAGLVGFGIQRWADGSTTDAMTSIPIGLTFLLLVPIRRKGGDLNSHWIWIATAVAIVGLLWAERRGWV